MTAAYMGTASVVVPLTTAAAAADATATPLLAAATAESG